VSALVLLDFIVWKLLGVFIDIFLCNFTFIYSVSLTYFYFFPFSLGPLCWSSFKF